MSSDHPPLLILGASTRAAAQSAARAGFRPICADCFADEDLREVAEVHQVSIENYPEGLVPVADSAPQCPWMYTGAMENYPRIVTQISRNRPLWGNSAEIIARSRDPLFTYETLKSAGLPAPRYRSSDDPPPADGRWMLKPERSGGGRGIRVWDESARDSRTLDEPHWFQERAEGLSLAAIFVAMPERTILVGVSRQLVGSEDGSGPAHGYSGSIAPCPLADEVHGNVERMGSLLAQASGLRGIFGIDFLLDDVGPWPVDLNPRYTASVEVLEYAYDLPIMAWHAAAFGTDPARQRRCKPGPLRRFVGKSVLFAHADALIPPLANLFENHRPRDGAHEEFTILADRPAVGEKIHAGKPICSVIVSGRSEACCRERLGECVRMVRNAVWGDNRDVEFR
ncbi:MAG: ATP-grasp domain-containing protein [Planctomycetaceae bacterium]